MTDITTAEVLLAGGYAVLLIIIACGLDLLARHAHRQADRFRTGGFRYDAEHDHWLCPEDEILRPHEYDHRRRLVRYRAPTASPPPLNTRAFRGPTCDAVISGHRCGWVDDEARSTARMSGRP